MTKRVLDVGNCRADHAAIKRFLETEFNARVSQTHGETDTLDMLRSGQFDLVLVNRKLDRDHGDGIRLIQRIKSDPALAAVPAMLVTNFGQYHEQAIEAGAVWGFGKSQLDIAETRARLASFLATAEQQCAELPG